jgi:hypothetical protein
MRRRDPARPLFAHAAACEPVYRALMGLHAHRVNARGKLMRPAATPARPRGRTDAKTEELTAASAWVLPRLRPRSKRANARSTKSMPCCPSTTSAATRSRHLCDGI